MKNLIKAAWDDIETADEHIGDSAPGDLARVMAEIAQAKALVAIANLLERIAIVYEEVNK